VDKLWTLHARLLVRLGPRRTITLTLGHVADALRKFAEAPPRALLGEEARARHVDRVWHELRASSEAFIEAAVEQVGTVPTSDGKNGPAD